MDQHRFETLTRVLINPGTRRRLLGALAALPLASGLGDILSPDEAEAKDRRRRRKGRHKKRQDKANGKRQRKQDRRECKPRKRDVVCAGKCGAVTSRDTCGKTVECGSCDCSPPCGECFTCQGVAGAPGTCVPQAGAPCGVAATCRAGELIPQASCDESGVCVAAGPITCAPNVCDGDACATSCTTNDQCSSNALCVAGSCHACDVTCTSGSAAECGDALQDALEDEELATVYVCPGTYVGRLSSDGGFAISRDVTVIGAGAEQTILDGNNERRVLQIAANVEVTLQALTITRGTDDDRGGGIDNSGLLTMRNTRISGNTAQYGGGIANVAGTVTLENGSIIEDNTASGDGGGIINDNGTVTLESGSIIEFNTANNDGGGMYNLYTAMMLESGSVIQFNTANNDGGGIANYWGTVTLAGGSTIAGNTAANVGGGIHNIAAPGTVTVNLDALICGNTEPQCSGDGDFAGDGTCPTAQDCPA